MEQKGTIIKVSGPLVVASGMQDAKMYEVVRVSEERLVGEVIELKGDLASIQVYEETGGLGPGQPVYRTSELLSVTLGPGMLTNIYDGIQRPLALIADNAKSAFIRRGIEVPGIDLEKKWEFIPAVAAGDAVSGGDVLGTVEETSLITHKILTPPDMRGVVKKIEKGKFTVAEPIVVIEHEGTSHKVPMLRVWPIRKPRPVKEKSIPTEPLVTGQRVIDAFFPIVKGGAGCVPGPFGAGKTVIQQQLAKWADADIIVYIGCGERGNEMTDVLMEFPELTDPKTGKPLMERTVLIANTSNMPVAAREASVYTGITIAEYYRDMGYKVALMADSTSRWAEAMREMSGRLEEMPGEEGYPAYLGSRTAAFYERAGSVVCLGKDSREASLTVVGAVSPPGGDLSEPVTQNTLRVTKVFWGLDASLAYKRHFPSINWLSSYSLYNEQVDAYMNKAVSSDWQDLRTKAMEILQQEAKLEEIVRLVGVEALSPHEQLVLDTAKSLREDFLQQNAFDETDTYTPLKKQHLMLKSIIAYHAAAHASLTGDTTLASVQQPELKAEIGRAKMVVEADMDQLESLPERITRAFTS
ncbi:MAG: V-type ATP synthase subunit A [Parcubacteria group bacterium CG08_land_8_20_14_0_20_48_21]|nr:MAG: V-type ATP synthase subunit A [Parcubacteria group bacterium CG2_30_48_51]PIS32491.1 MAG: V-type ATP synthase subunit A [Parcubacteria group bacterium CG08_land_8_20_14_0_20_48_21]PIW78839.1 MAG: V-type ATP synthase subunit A [Parcubacteria group bacterium CG_4_8_14_3_um_filter_48_16]PIY78012.1 MAG: V-type ATP synthase subunit A [Parcubacteria group bacterium CG_4_10_14_0_8_um_filter_48_154]PIZ77129.1 MAG: V-type ATP synthase subunit A [bacterium CG_4_10_14_0_2_um_filter_48_144]PJC3979